MCMLLFRSLQATRWSRLDASIAAYLELYRVWSKPPVARTAHRELATEARV